ncbi:MAG TPA: substrate-binding domain-containing protein, partial [Burkholderiales bacterium]
MSISSVSRVLNGSGYASSSLKARVARAVAETGYTPSFAARHLRTGRSRAIGFMVSNLANPFLAALVARVEELLRLAGFALLVASTYDQREREEELLTLFQSRQLEGVFAAPSTEGLPRSRDPYARCRLPLVILDREISFDADAVFLDHRSAIRQSVEYLVELGHRRIALLGPNEQIRPGREKLLGYRDGLQAHGIPYDENLVCMLRSAVDSPEQQVSRMLSGDDPPTAMIGLGTRILAGALRAARRAQLEIPADLSIIGIGTPDVFAYMYPPMTTLRFDIETAASSMTQLMLDRIAGSAPREPRRVHI